MSNHIFRKKSLEKVSSPEQLNDYIRASSPGVWTVLAAVAILLLGVCIWGAFGRVDTVVQALAVCEDGKTRCYVAQQDYDSIAVGMPVRVNGQERTIASIARLPEKVSDDLNVYIQHAEVLQGAGWVYALQLDEGIDEGVYAAQIVTESIAPASFLWN